MSVLQKELSHFHTKNNDFAMEVFDFLSTIIVSQRAFEKLFEKSWFCKAGRQFFAASARPQILPETSVAKASNCHCSPINFFSIFIPFSTIVLFPIRLQGFLVAGRSWIDMTLAREQRPPHMAVSQESETAKRKITMNSGSHVRHMLKEC